MKGQALAVALVMACGLAMMIMSRSQEQPYPSARAIPLPAGNKLTLLQVLGNIYLVAGGPSNVVVQVGNDGVLVVDTATPEVSDQVLQAIRVLTDKPISYIVNTTGEKDHYGGNELIAKAGRNPTQAAQDLAGPGSIPPPGAAPAGGDAGDAGEGLAQVSLDVHGQRLQGRDVEDAAGGARRSGLEHQAVESREKRGQGLARARRSEDQGGFPLEDRGPAEGLGPGRTPEGLDEPFLHGRPERDGEKG
jgi:hypothetical protein